MIYIEIKIDITNNNCDYIAVWQKLEPTPAPFATRLYNNRQANSHL